MFRIYIWNKTNLFTGSEGNFRTSLPILLLLNWNSKRWKLGTSTVLKVIFIKKNVMFSLLYYYNVTSQSPCKCRQAQEAGSRKPPERFVQFLRKECQRAHIIDSGQQFTLPCQESQGRWFCSLLPYYYFLKVYNTYILQTTSVICWDLIEHIPYVNNRRREKYEIMYGQNFKDDSDT